jgi:hypothetical protein
MSNFKKQLKIGENFENNSVLPLLLDLHPDYWIEATHDYKTGDYAGPKIHRYCEKSLTLPDFKLHNPDNSHRIMYEAKYKSSAFSIHGFVDVKFVAIELDKVLAYQKVANIFSSELKFVIGCAETNGIHICTDWLHHNFNNEHYKGIVCAFKLTDENKVRDLQ